MTSSNSFKAEDFVIKKEDVTQFLKGLSDFTIYAPVQEEDAVLFKVIQTPDKIALQFTNSVKSPKHVVLPQTETMLKVTKGKENNINIDEPNLDEKNILFGIRPCDARGIAILDKVFSGDFEDPYYLKRRDNTTLIGLACTDPHRNCFCTSVGGAPDSTEGLDMLWTDIGDTFYINVLTEKGMELIKGTVIFSKATSENTKAKNKVHKAAKEKITEKLNAEALPKKLESLFEDEYWDNLSMKCLCCGSCTYLCPTCYCFDINDIEYRDKVKRVRTWDSCQFSSYTIHTSGHNPRPNKENRMRNRMYHKYKYHYDNFKELGCVGCGRCITYCPVNMNVKATIRELAEK